MKGYTTAKQLSEKHDIKIGIIHQTAKRQKVRSKVVKGKRYFELQDFYNKVNHYKIVKDMAADIENNADNILDNTDDNDFNAEEYLQVKNDSEKLKKAKLAIDVKIRMLELKAKEREYIPWSEVELFTQQLGLLMREYCEVQAGQIARKVSEAMGYNEELLQKITLLIEDKFEQFLKMISLKCEELSQLGPEARKNEIENYNHSN